MAILGPETSRIEVQVFKLPANPAPDDHAKPDYLEEYGPLGEMRVPRDTITRYIVPEGVNYGIEVKFKAGFQHGDFNNAIVLRLVDKTTKAVLYRRRIHSSDKSTHFSKDTSFFITTLPDVVVVDCKKMKNVQLAFNDLVPDNALPFISEAPGFKAEELAGFMLEIRRDGEYISGMVSEVDYRLEMQNHWAKMHARSPASATKAKDTTNWGTEVTDHQEIPTRTIRETTALGKHESRFAHFLFRSPLYMTVHKLYKTPIPSHFQCWQFLNEPTRRQALKILQDYDKEKTVICKIAHAGDDANPRKIRKELLDSLPVVDRWRSWHTMVARESEGHYNRLQVRFHHWGNQEEKAPSDWSEPAKCTESEIEEENEKNHPIARLVIRNGVIIIDGTPSPNPKRTLAEYERKL